MVADDSVGEKVSEDWNHSHGVLGAGSGMIGSV